VFLASPRKEALRNIQLPNVAVKTSTTAPLIGTIRCIVAALGLFVFAQLGRWRATRSVSPRRTAVFEPQFGTLVPQRLLVCFILVELPF
jgi:hypothetical protein